MALEPIDCTSHSREIEQAYLKVVRGGDADTTWLIISPNEKKEYTPAFVGSGFSEFLETFDDAKVQFGMARVSPPGSDVEKLILIGWCPDSAPMKTRASFAANFGTVANQVLKGYHVQVTARDEDDLDEKELLQKISNAAGARYSIQMNADKPKVTRQPKVSSPPPAKESPKPISQPQVRSPAPSPANPIAQARSPAPSPAKPVPVRDSDLGTDDWNEPEVEERDLNKNPLQASQSTYKPIGRVDLKQVIAEEKAREDPRLVSATSGSQKIAPEADIARLKQESKLKRDNEINKFLGTKPPLAPSSSQKNDDMVIKGFKNEKSPAQLWAEKKAADSGSPDRTVEPVQSESAKTPADELPAEEEEENVHDLKSKFEKLGASSNEPPIITPRPAAQIPSTSAAGENESPKFDSKKFGTPLPGMHAEISKEDREESESDGEWDDEEPSAPALPSRDIPQHPAKTEEEKQEVQASHESKISEPEQKDESAEDEPPAPALPARSSGAPAPPPPARRSAPAKPASPCAIAEYDYEAAEDNELTFSENDKIINIDFVDEDWWLGELEKTGEKGLFPSNYVVLQE